ncbi:GntR family transcriptional regulator [Tianweitania sediminis]|uniref:GntR family transcriptional regulator n=1 Tax=Tianweitania sediminis TaxID=1502156 RepID=A0A8J7REK9_9HYPH|nr:GntR family transcriptional regulator [Tianweitania sediminis]MBP0437066.1 GntR family transcriptional regulator [Tianweitania sediminis]
MDLPLKVSEPIAPQLVAALRQAIVGLSFQPGEALSEKDIAARFGVSRQPVREAFIKLSEAGLVEIRPSRGTYVMKISVREVANARLVREAIESDIARHAARLARPPHIAMLNRLIKEQRDAANAGDYWRFNEGDEAFHRAIGEIVDCDYAWRVVESARIQTDRTRLLSLPEASPMPLLLSQHEAIVRQLEAGDPDGAERTMRRHLREILVALPQIAATHPNLFSDTILPAHTEGLVPRD